MDIHRTEVQKAQSLLKKADIASADLLQVFKALPAWIDSLRAVVADDLLHTSVQALESKVLALKARVGELEGAAQPDGDLVKEVKEWVETASEAQTLLRGVEPTLDIINIDAEKLLEKTLVYDYELQLVQGLFNCTVELSEEGLSTKVLQDTSAFLSKTLVEGKSLTPRAQETLQAAFENLAVCLGAQMGKMEAISGKDEAETSLTTLSGVHGSLSLLHRVLGEECDPLLRECVMTMFEPHFPLYAAIVGAMKDQKDQESAAETFASQPDFVGQACHVKSCLSRCSEESEQDDGDDQWEDMAELKEQMLCVKKAMEAFLKDVVSVVQQRAKVKMTTKDQEGKGLFGKSWKATLAADVPWVDLCKVALNVFENGDFLKKVSAWTKEVQQETT